MYDENMVFVSVMVVLFAIAMPDEPNLVVVVNIDDSTEQFDIETVDEFEYAIIPDILSPNTFVDIVALVIESIEVLTTVDTIPT
jgi:hypothetical protein